MKILTIPREELHNMFPRYSWIGDPSVADWIEQQLKAAGFDMTRALRQYKDEYGNRVYVQKDHEEDIETAFEGK